MPLHHALLSLLEPGESYGYELRAEFERRVGPQWGTLNIGHVYQLLDRLRRDGLVAVARAEPQPRGTDRVIYAITDAGRAELRRWLARSTGTPAGYRDEIHLKLVAGARAGAEALRAVVRVERQALLGELHALRTLVSGDAVGALLVDGAALQVEARLRLLDGAEEDAAALAAAARPASAGRRSDAGLSRRAGP